MTTPNPSLSSYRFSHNDSQESAKECIKRMNASKQISHSEFLELVGHDTVEKLEAALGKRAHSFYVAKGECGENLAYADIHAIHYIFIECKESTPMEISNLFEKKMFEFRFTFSTEQGVSFNVNDASAYFKQAARAEDNVIVFNGAENPLYIVYDLYDQTNIRDNLIHKGDKIEAYGFCSEGKLEELKAKLIADAKDIVCAKIREHKKIIEKLEDLVAGTLQSI